MKSTFSFVIHFHPTPDFINVYFQDGDTTALEMIIVLSELVDSDDKMPCRERQEIR